MSHIPEDRHKYGLVLDYTLGENLELLQYFEPRFQSHGFLKKDEIKSYAQSLIEKFDIRCSEGPGTKARSMSGGNQHGHMHHAVFTLIDADHHTQEWTYMMPGDKPMRARMDLIRVK
jgi:hypothetical protein